MQRQTLYCATYWLVLVVLTMFAAACGVASDPIGQRAEPHVDSATQALLSSAAVTIPTDDASPHAIVLHWDDDSGELLGASSVNIVVENTTDQLITVELSIVALDLGEARVLSRDLREQTVGAYASASVAIPVSKIPLQTVGVDSPWQVRAVYSFDGYNPMSGRAERFDRATSSEPRHATFSQDFGTASIRGHRAQTRHNTQLHQILSGSPPVEAARALTAKRTLDHATGTMRSVGHDGFVVSSRLIDKGDPAMPPAHLRKIGVR